MTSWLSSVISLLKTGQSACLVALAEVRGSSPRDAGAYMIVTQDSFSGTIGGGVLEYEALSIARKMLAEASQDKAYRQFRDFALGPNMGQCCGGHVSVMFDVYDESATDALSLLADSDALYACHKGAAYPVPIDADGLDYKAADKALTWRIAHEAPNLFIYGAGHVGRALIDVTGHLGLRRHWVDVSKDRFPASIPSDVVVVPAKDMSIIAANAPADSYHIIMTYSHQMDEALVHSILKKGAFLKCGLIGSHTKAARFKSRLQKAGLPQTATDRLICPIGLPDIKSKEPGFVAMSIAAQIACWCEEA